MIIAQHDRGLGALLSLEDSTYFKARSSWTLTFCPDFHLVNLPFDPLQEERRAKKEAEENKRREARAQRMAEFEKWKNPPQRNFVITKREDGSTGLENDNDDSPGGMPKKSKEQLEAEKQAILSQRIPACNTSGMDSSKLTEKAKELHNLIYRLEGEKYDLEKRYKAQQYDVSVCFRFGSALS